MSAIPKPRKIGLPVPAEEETSFWDLPAFHLPANAFTLEGFVAWANLRPLLPIH